MCLNSSQESKARSLSTGLWKYCWTCRDGVQGFRGTVLVRKARRVVIISIRKLDDSKQAKCGLPNYQRRISLSLSSIKIKSCCGMWADPGVLSPGGWVVGWGRVNTHERPFIIHQGFPDLLILPSLPHGAVCSLNLIWKNRHHRINSKKVNPNAKWRKL